MQATRHCPECDAVIEADQPFCSRCGAALTSKRTASRSIMAPPKKSGFLRLFLSIVLLLVLVAGLGLGAFVMGFIPSEISTQLHLPSSQKANGDIVTTPISDSGAQQTAQALQAAAIQAQAIATAEAQALATTQALHAQGTAQSRLAATVQIAEQEATAASFQSTATAQAQHMVGATATASVAREQLGATQTASTLQATAMTATPLPDALEIIEVKASSYSYEPERVLSNSWWYSADGEGVGAWIDLTFPSPRVVTGIGFWTAANSKEPKDINLLFADGSTQKLQLKKAEGFQFYELTPISTHTVRLTIESLNDQKETQVGIRGVKVFGR